MTSLFSQPFQNQPLRHHHARHFEFESVRELPDSHVWPLLDDHPAADPSVTEPVPIIDLADPDAETRVSRACAEWGVFQVTGHGVPACLLERLESQARRLFSLPTHQKLRAARSPGGVTGYGLAPISSFFSKLMWSEGFTVAGSPLDHARELWPHDHSQFCDVLHEYDREMEELAGRLVRLMLRSLGVDDEGMKWAGPVQRLQRVLQLNSYPACPDPDRAMGLAAHTDSSLFNIVYQSSTSGLQVLRSEDGGAPARWVTVPPLPGALVVNVGDLLHILSNGRFKSVFHRAVVNRSHHRLSAACICGPPPHVKITPIGAGEEPAYRAVTWAEYLGLKAKLFHNALASLKRDDH